MQDHVDLGFVLNDKTAEKNTKKRKEIMEQMASTTGRCLGLIMEEI